MLEILLKKDQFSVRPGNFYLVFEIGVALKRSDKNKQVRYHKPQSGKNM